MFPSHWIGKIKTDNSILTSLNGVPLRTYNKIGTKLMIGVLLYDLSDGLLG